MFRPGAWRLCRTAVFLRVACFLCSVFLEPFLLNAIKRNQAKDMDFFRRLNEKCDGDGASAQ
jgi:hypothetical protein